MPCFPTSFVNALTTSVKNVAWATGKKHKDCIVPTYGVGLGPVADTPLTPLLHTAIHVTSVYRETLSNSQKESENTLGIVSVLCEGPRTQRLNLLS